MSANGVSHPQCPPRLPRLVRFYDPVNPAPDSSGRTLSSILAWDDSELEYCHDYIQNLFPLPERSPFNPSAPIIDREIFRAFHSRPELQARLKESFVRIIKFYGFKLIDTHATVEVKPASNFNQASRNWVTRLNHNHLRITRIIRSLRVLGLEKEARAFFSALQKVHTASNISSKSLMFWTRAAQRPLYIAPEDEEDNGDAGDYLYEYEEAKEAEEKSREVGQTIEIDGDTQAVRPDNVKISAQGDEDTTTSSTSDCSAESPGKSEASSNEQALHQEVKNPSESLLPSKRKLEDVDEVAR